MPATQPVAEEMERLRTENARLIVLLEAHCIEWRLPPKLEQLAAAPATIKPSPLSLQPSTEEKVALFRRLFRGRADVYPVRWENRAGKSGYSPACANEWRVGVCEKPSIN